MKTTLGYIVKTTSLVEGALCLLGPVALPSLHRPEGAINIVRDRLDLQLLVDELVLDLVDPDVQPLDVHLRVLRLGLGHLQPGNIQ